MTSRPAFFPINDSVAVDDTQAFEFTWNPGFAFSQKQKNVLALHASILNAHPGCRPLEVSSKSTLDLGVRLSAFNLSIPYKDSCCSVESVFQASKVFEQSGPFPEMYAHDSREVRDYVKANAKGRLIGFETPKDSWGLNPTRAFYDWIYINTLVRNEELANALDGFDCFTDIEFNPRKSLNCQAYAVALYLSLKANGVLESALKDKASFLKYHPTDVVVVGTGTNRHEHTECEHQGTFDFGDMHALHACHEVDK